MHPTVIVDHFFEDPHDILSFAHQLNYAPSADGRWPGVRNVDDPHPRWQEFKDYLKHRLQQVGVFPHLPPDKLFLLPKFQLIHPTGLDRHDYGNRGFVHHDHAPFFNTSLTVQATVMIYLNARESSHYGGTCLLEKKPHMDNPYLGLDIKHPFLYNNQHKKIPDFDHSMKLHWDQFERVS